VVHGVGGAGERLGRHPETLLVPEVHPSFISNLDNRLDVGKQLGGSADDRILGIKRQIGVVEVEQVVVADASRRVTPVDHVPYRLEERPSGQPPVRDV